MKKVFFAVSLFLVMFVQGGNAQVTVGSLLNANGGALLDLKESNNTTSSTKGLNFPRVALTSLTELYPMYSPTSSDYANTTTRAALKASHIGLTVYNLTATGGFNPGLHVWNGTNWVRPVTELPSITETSVNMLNLRTATGAQGDVSIALGTAYDGAGGTILYFGDDGYVTIPENGSYVFSFRLYGHHGYGAAVYYLSLWANGTVSGSSLSNATLKDIAELDLSINRLGDASATVATYSINMGAYFRAGDRVRFKLSYNNDYIQYTYPLTDGTKMWRLRTDPTPTRADRTSMIWWKL